MFIKWRMTFGALVGMFIVSIACAQNDELPEEFEQIVPRGAIAGIVEPEFVSVDKADIDGDSWVLGVVVDGQARAYSLNLLDAHEVVNDRLGETAFAAVW